MSLEIELNYAQKQRSVQAKLEDCIYYPERIHSSYLSISGNEYIQFKIGRKNNTFLDPHRSYLSFSCIPTCQAAATCVLENNAYSLIKRITVSQGGVRLEDIQDTNTLSCMLLDFSSSMDQRQTTLNALAGTYKTGDESTYWGRNRMGAVLKNGLIYNFALNLPSSIIGLMASSKYLPLHNMAEPILIDIYLDNAIRTVTTTPTPPTAAGTIKLGNFKFNAQHIVLSDDAMSKLISLNGGILNLHTETWNIFKQPVPAANIEQDYILNYPSPHYRSLKGMCWFPIARYQSTLNSYFTITGRSLYRTRHVRFRVGDELFPKHPIKCQYSAESSLDAYVSMMNLFNAFGKSDFHTSLGLVEFYGVGYDEILGSSNANNDPLDDTSHLGTSGNLRSKNILCSGGAVGVNLEAFEGSSSFWTGLDTHGQDLVVEYRNYLMNSAYNAFLCVNYDQLLQYDLNTGLFSVHK